MLVIFSESLILYIIGSIYGISKPTFIMTNFITKDSSTDERGFVPKVALILTSYSPKCDS